MSDSGPLIVPVEVQAMVVNNPNMNFIRGAMNYGQLANYMSPSPAPFQQDQVDFAGATTGAGVFQNHGVYLMWTLPQALRHGRQNASGGLDFPLVPNRWLVVRVYRPAVAQGAAPPAAKPSVAAWVIESDFLHPSQGTSAFLDPGAKTQTPTFIGQQIGITSTSPWQEPANPRPYFLRAVTESNPAFAAYQPFNQNVFSIFDNLVAEQIGAGTLSYFVLGWYSQSTADILSGWQPGVKGKDFSDLLKQLNWTASATGTSTSTSLYQGAAFGISWQPGGAAPASPKDGVMPQVAIGNTSIDGVVEFAKTAFQNTRIRPDSLNPQQAVDLLEAFQYNLLPMLTLPGAEAMIEQQIRNQWFGSAPAGTGWTIVDAQTPPGQAPPSPPTATELANEALWLSALNKAQSQFDQAVRDLMGVQRDLFEYWWKKGGALAFIRGNGWDHWPWTINPNPEADPTDPSVVSAVNARFESAMAPLISQAQALMTQLNTLATQIPTETATISLSQAIVNFANLKNLPSNRALKAVAAARFWAPGDPVAVISNTAHLLKIDPDTALQCRWPSEVVSELNVSAAAGNTTQFTISSSQIAQFLPAVNWTNLPSLGKSLFAEFFLLDPSNAALVAAGANQNLNAAQIGAVALSMSPPKVANGLVPAVHSAYPCPQAWQPIYLDWEIEWIAIPFQQSNGTPNWTFNGLDYDLVPGLAAPTTPSPVLTGRAVLTPKPSFEFKARIDQFIKDYPTSSATQLLSDIEGPIQTVDGWDFLSQTLSGLSTQIASWNPVPVQNPDSTPLRNGGSLLELIGDQARMPPNPPSGDPPRGDPTVIPPSTFEGMRGGQFYVNRLTIVDAFGQTLEIVFAPTLTNPLPVTATNDVFHPLLSDGVAPTEPILTLEPLRLAQLPPRLLQMARLNFNFTPEEGDNPIVGWILPNHIDSGLSVYDPTGIALGELTLGVDQNDHPVVDWMPAPNSPFPTLPDPAPGQGPLIGFLANLKHLGTGAFSDFLQGVDETLWTVDPLGNRSDSFLSVLIGRPLAVVAASVSFELQADPWRDPDWPYTFAHPKPDPLFLNYKFPVRLGDLGFRQDGLIGYFLDGDYLHFNAIHLPERGRKDPPLSGYLKQIAVGNYIPLGFAKKGPGTPATLTMIMDPRGSVHAQCGFLPVKEVTLVPDWVDSALSKVAITFRTGPVLVGTQQLIPKGQTDPITVLLLTSPAEQHGTWSWVESDGHGHWPETTLAPVDGTASFPVTPPTLREGLLKLTGGMDE